MSQFPKRPKYDIFQEVIFYILASSKNMLLKVFPNEEGQNLCLVFRGFLLKGVRFSSFHVFLKRLELKRKCSNNHTEKAVNFFTFKHFLFTRSKRELNYYQQKVNIRVTSTVGQ